MKLCFTLTMPNRGSWNGRWSGENNLYARVVNYGASKKAKEKAHAIIKGGPYYHRWNDGWGASIDVRAVEGAELRRIKKESKGFCGYDWMISNIRAYGSTYEPKEAAEA